MKKADRSKERFAFFGLLIRKGRYRLDLFSFAGLKKRGGKT